MCSFAYARNTLKLRLRSPQFIHSGDDDLEEQRKRLEARRAYSKCESATHMKSLVLGCHTQLQDFITHTDRMNAARARKRTKDRISDLCIKVEEQAGINAKLQKTNKELTDRLDRLSDENRELRRLAAQTRALKLGLPDAAASLFSGDTGAQNALQQQLPGNLINVSGLLPLLQQNPILGCLPGGGFPQLLSPADQQRLLRAGLNEQPSTDSSAFQNALLLQQAGLQPSLPSLVTGADTLTSDPQYFDLVSSLLAGKIGSGIETPKEVQNGSPQGNSAPV